MPAGLGALVFDEVLPMMFVLLTSLAFTIGKMTLSASAAIAERLPPAVTAKPLAILARVKGHSSTQSSRADRRTPPSP